MKTSPQPLRALLVEDSETDALLLIAVLRRGGYAPDWERVETEPALRAALAAHPWDVVFCDYSLPMLDAAKALGVLRETSQTLTAIVVSGQSGEDVAVEAMRLGANDFILKQHLDRVVPALERELSAAGLRREREAATVALRQSEGRYRALFDESPWPMWVYDPKTLRYLAVNERAVKDYGYSREEYLSMSVADIRPQEDVPELLAYFDRIETGAYEPPKFTWRHRKKDGSVIVVEVAHQPITYDGQPAGIVQAIDVTARVEAESALRESEERFRQVAENIDEAFWVADPLKDRKLYVSPAYEKIWDRPCADLLAAPHSWIESVHPDDRERIVEATRANQIDGNYDVEYRILRADGSIRWIHDRAFAVRDAEGSVCRIVGLAGNITARKQAEEVLAESERRFREMLENIALIAMTLDLKGRITFCNDYFLRTTGWKREEALGADWFSQFIPGNPELKSLFPENGEPEGIPAHHENPIRTKSGAMRQIAWNNTMLRGADGRIVGVASIGDDVTERRMAEEQIREQAELLDHAQDAILVQTVEGRIEYWNKSAERVFGWTANEALGRNVQDLLYESLAPYDFALKTALSRGNWLGDLTKCTKAGGEVLIEGRWTLVRDETGQPKAILAINTDVTEQKKIEAHLFRAQRMESIGTLAGGIAHDLNNVLGPIIMAVDLLKLRVRDPRDRDLLALMETSGRRGADMVKQVLFFARGMAGRREPINPAELVDELRRIVRDTFPKSISLATDIPAKTWKVSGDRTQLHQVLLNLCVNARDAMPRGGGLRLSARNRQIDEQFAAMNRAARPGPYVVFEVADTGEGMKPEVVERIFEPFFTTKELGKGTGLGLSTTQAIVQNHAGFMTVESEPGKGTTFQVNLPAETAPAGTELATGQTEFPRGAGEMILIIDDEAAIRSITGQTLEAFGYQVISAGDGAEGVAKYAQHSHEIAAVLTDMMMPVLDGAATIRVLLRLNPEVKIIATSGLTAHRAGTDVTDTGAKYFLPKPYTAEALLRTLGKVLHPHP